MKATYLEEVESRKAFSHKMRCSACGSNLYKIIHQIQPWPDQWWVSCEECGKEGPMSPTREVAIERWKQE